MNNFRCNKSCINDKSIFRMQQLFNWGVIIICFVTVTVGVIVVLRKRLKNKLRELTEKLSQISSFSGKINSRQEREGMDIPSDLHNSFYGKEITISQKKEFINHYNAPTI